MLPVWAVVAIIVGSWVALLYQGLAILLAYDMPRLGAAAPSPVPTASPKVSVIIAARNEEMDLPGTLDDLLAQDYPNLEIVVVEDRSTDGTRAVIDARATRVRCVDPPPLPTGWIGKNWACATGARATTGDWLLFLDADVRTHPAAVRTALDWAREQQADLATLATKIDMVGFWERLVMPFYVQMTLVYFRSSRVNRPGSSAAMANGQFWLTPRAAYERVGGHDSVRNKVLEDVEIARRYRAAGLTLRIAWAPELAHTRMYRGRREISEGLVRTIQGSGVSAARLAGYAAGLFVLFLLPLAVLPIGLATGSLLLAGMGAFLWIALFGKHVAFARAVGAPGAYGLAYPAAVVAYMGLLLTAFGRRLVGRPVQWKGRAYGPKG
jgi:chlorobactene glucosyltransferase